MISKFDSKINYNYFYNVPLHKNEFSYLLAIHMESLNAQLRVVKQKFPEQGDRIEQLFEVDEDFRTLCYDYLLCMRQLLEIKKEFTEKQHSMKEYKHIREELEKELHDFIFSQWMLPASCCFKNFFNLMSSWVNG